MRVENNSNNNFKAKFFDTASMRQIAAYSQYRGKFGKLRQAAENISKDYMTTRLLVRTGINDKGFSYVTFSKYVPKDSVIVPRSIEDYKFIKDRTYTATKFIDPLKFAMEKIIKMGNNAPKNGIYRDTIVKNT